MNFLEEKILIDGTVKPGGVLKVDSFLNHRLDIKLLDQIGAELKRRYADEKITKVLTIESSGIAIACSVARELGVPVVFAKKAQSVNLDGEMYVAEVDSYIVPFVQNCITCIENRMLRTIGNDDLRGFIGQAVVLFKLFANRFTQRQ